MAAPTIGGKSFTSKKPNKPQTAIDADRLKSVLESKLLRVTPIFRSKIIKNEVVKSHDIVSFFQQSASIGGEHGKRTVIKAYTQDQVLDGIVDDIRKYLDRVSIYYKAGFEVTAGLRVAAGVSKSASIDANLASLQVFKYEIMNDSKEGMNIYNQYVLKKNENGHHQFVRSHAFELILGAGAGVKTEVTREILGSRTDSEKRTTGQTSEAQFAATIPFAPILSVFVKPEYDRFKDKYTTKIGVTLSGKFGAVVVGEGGGEIGININH